MARLRFLMMIQFAAWVGCANSEPPGAIVRAELLEIAETPALVERNNIAKIDAWRACSAAARFTLTKTGPGIDSRYTRRLEIRDGRARVVFVTAGGAARDVSRIEIGTLDKDGRFVAGRPERLAAGAQVFLRCVFHGGDVLF